MRMVSIMITIKSCKDVPKKVIFETFLNGFVDYPVKFPADEEFFFERFFGAEGNHLKSSFIAEEDGKGIGLILGGIRKYDGIKTLRCGTMCIIPEFRGSGIAKKLWTAHKEEGQRQGCKQLFLEVLHDNIRATNFYEKNGYEKRYILKYYMGKLNNSEVLNPKKNIVKITFEQIKNFRQSNFGGLHINWQNEIESIELNHTENFGLFEEDNLVGAFSVKNGNIFFFGVQQEYRGKGIGTDMLNHINETNHGEIRISFSNNASIEGFCKKRMLKLNDVFQYEMYQNL